MASNGPAHQTPNPPTPRRWSRSRELAGIAIVVVLLLVGGGLAMVLRGRHASSRPATTSIAKSSVPPVFSDDPGAEAVYAQGLGQEVDIERQISGYPIDVRWIYADTARVLVYYTITMPPNNGPAVAGLRTHLAITASSGTVGQVTQRTSNGWPPDGLYTTSVLASAPAERIGSSENLEELHLQWSDLRVYVQSPTTVINGTPTTPTTSQDTLSGTASTRFLTSVQPGYTSRNLAGSVQPVGLLSSLVVAVGPSGTRVSYGAAKAASVPSKLHWTLVPGTGASAYSVDSSVQSDQSSGSVIFSQPPGSETTSWALTAQPVGSGSRSSIFDARFDVAHVRSVPDSIIRFPDVLKLFQEGYGVSPNQTVQVGGRDALLQWVYADAHEVWAAFAIVGVPSRADLAVATPDLPHGPVFCPGVQGVTLSIDPNSGSARDAGLGTSVSGDGAGIFGRCLVTEALEFSGNPGSVSFNVRGRTIGSDTFSFTATVPLLQARKAAVHQHELLNGQSLTLDGVGVTPTGMRLAFGGAASTVGPSGPLLGSRMTVNGHSAGEYPLDTSTRWDPKGDRTIVANWIDANWSKPWTIKVIPTDGSGKAVTDPGKIATFTFDLPAAGWSSNLSLAATPAARPAATPTATPTATATPVAQRATPMSIQQIKDSNAFNDSPGAQRVVQAGLGTFMDKSEKAGQARVDVRWAYADMNEVAVFYTIRDRPPIPSRYQASMPPQAAARIACPGQLTIPPTSGMIFDDPTGYGRGPDEQTQVCLLVAHTSLSQQNGPLSVDLSGNLGFSDPPDPSQAYHLVLSIPLAPGLVAKPGQESHVDGKPVTLDRFVVTPSRVAITLSGPGKGGTAAIQLPDINIDGWDWWKATDAWAAFGRVGDEVVYSLVVPTNAYPPDGNWKIKIIPYIVTSTPSASHSATDPAKIATFIVKLPQPNWLPAT